MKHLVSLLALALTCGASATDAIWKSDLSSYSTWVKAENWQDASGATLAAPPTNANDTAFIAAPTGTAYVIRFGYSSAATAEAKTATPAVTNLVVRKISATGMPTLDFGTEVTASPYFAQTVTVEYPDEFPGFWTSDSGRARLTLKATATHEPVVSHFDTYGYNAINVPDAGTAARVTSLLREGALVKEGAGELTVERGGAHVHVYVKGGTLTLKGVPEEQAEPYVPEGAYLHLDASRADTLDTFTESYATATGTATRTCIARWRDCAGGSVCAETNGFCGTIGHLLPYSRAPFISEEKSPSGLPLVDFGANFTVKDTLLPTNCYLQLNTVCEVAREIYFVGYCNTAAAGNARDRSALFGFGGGTERYDLANGGCNTVFVGWAKQAAKDGAIYINGLRAQNNKMWATRYAADLTSLHLTSCAFDRNLGFATLGTDRCYSTNTGGWRVGEILVFDRVLSDEERRALTDYLMKKWFKDYRTDDAGEVVVHADSAAIGVPAGRIARVKSLSAQGASKIVKTGGGTLVVEGVTPAGVPLEIRGGALRVESPAVSSDGPAANPMLWLDASVASSFVHSNDVDGATEYITRWNDCRSDVTAYYAEIPPVTGNTTFYTDAYCRGQLPKVHAAVSPTGLAAVDFGAYNDGSWMWLQPRGQTSSYAGFVAIRVKQPQCSYQYFGTSGTDILKNSPSLMIQNNWGNEKGLMPAWMIDGTALDPWFDHSPTYATTAWRVVSFSGGATKLTTDLLSKYSATQDRYVGNVEIGEMILFDRTLSAAERRNTEAYLMRKWLDKAHPEAPESFAPNAYAFGADVAQVIDVGAGSVTVTNLAGGSGVLQKYGTGALVLADAAAVTNLTAVKVEEGSLSFNLDVPDDAAYRYDASQADSFTETYTTDDGAGGLVTNILAWTDQAAGIVAKSAVYDGVSKTYAGASGSCCTNPTLVMAEMPDGVLRPAVDFGGHMNVATIWTGSKGSYVFHPELMNDSAGFKLESFGDTTRYKMAEAHVIVADQKATTGRFFGAWGSADDTFLRASGCMFAKANANVDRGAVYYGKVYLDGNLVAAPEKEPFSRYTFHLVSIQPTNAVTMQAISMDRNCNSGGNRISEVVAYKKTHTPEVFAFIQKKLMAKWFGAARPAWISTFDELRAAPGATLTVTSPATLAVGTVSGGGAIAIPVVSGVSTIRVDAADHPITVSGQVTLAAQGTVRVDDMTMLRETGLYPLFVADALAFAEGGSPATWTLDVDAPRLWLKGLVFDGSAIKLKIQRKGLTVYIR